MENVREDRPSRLSVEGFSLSGQQPQGTFVLTVRGQDGQSPLELEVDHRSLEGLSYILRQQGIAVQGRPHDPAADELRKIREILARLEVSVPLSEEIANSLFAMIEANYQLPKKETG